MTPQRIGKILTVVGARPQFVKAAVVGRRIRSDEFSGLREILVHTGQHYDADMSQVFFDELGIAEPAHHLGVGSGSHGAQTGAIMTRLEEVVALERPDIMLVYGDTNSTLAAALVAAKSSIPLAHVEAGLRSYRRGMPEEVNRVVTDRLSDLLLCPTLTSIENLAREGRLDAQLVGDVMFDIFLHEKKCAIRNASQKFDLEHKSYILATIHRAENTEDRWRLSSIIGGFARVQTPVLLPLHPRTRTALSSFEIPVPPNVKVVAPQSYRNMVGLLLDAMLVATDSGGLQKEAVFARVPCVTLRDETEWLETIETGWNQLAPGDASGIAECLKRAMEKPAAAPPEYGNGDAAGLILKVIQGYIAKQRHI